VFPYLAATTASLAVLVGFVATIIDRKDFPTFGTGVWWAIVTLGTVGYGDIVPTTAWGRVLGGFVIVFGVTFISFLTATVTSYFVSIDQEAEQAREREFRGRATTRLGSCSGSSTHGWPRSSGLSVPRGTSPSRLTDPWDGSRLVARLVHEGPDYPEDGEDEADDEHDEVAVADRHDAGRDQRDQIEDAEQSSPDEPPDGQGHAAPPSLVLAEKTRSRSTFLRCFL
jgi:hypothetical protein